jgi:vacuolar protein-sorting-associated protein 4
MIMKRKTDSIVSNQSSALIQENRLQESIRKDLILKTIVCSNEKVLFTDIAGLEDVKQLISEGEFPSSYSLFFIFANLSTADFFTSTILLPRKYPLFFKSRKTWTKLLLYGPPGTGKTRLAKAAAYESSSVFFSLSSADLLVSRKVRFVVFIDEVDSLCRKRTEREDDCTRRVKTELLKQIDGHPNVFLLCATNCPWDLDKAFLRRFQRRIYIPLPNAPARRKLFEIHIGEVPCALSKEDFELLINRTEGYSGSDIADLCLDALLFPLREHHFAPELKTFYASDSKFTVDEAPLRNVIIEDFLKSLTNVKTTITADDLNKYQTFI